ncbi:YciI family protein [Bailinhaonella thermotolerans]|uniref:YCII-related domain-containing protein n=1 Tax=Bailinhaonella thermotolerans TaxID=1070861 RepID=A0A3A4AW98_9ACTN|nr:YciI family protein [Bailinhaonella thermotolerans]RJL34520.1 hypothetical protein D5H75_08915 [Bailinhaonella thermotolerans]
MKQYMIAMHQPDAPPPPQEFLDPIMEQLHALEREIRDAGCFVFSGALHRPSAATVLRREGDEVLTTDGPYTEGKEYIGGFTIVRAPDLDAALAWGRRTAEITGLPIEVWPFQDEFPGAEGRS